MKKYEANWNSLDKRKIPTWFNEAKFGIFVHWGVYSVPAWRKLSPERFGSYAEWYYASVIGEFNNNEDDFHLRNYGEDFKYRDFAPDFKAELFDPDQWAEMFKNSGAKYVVLTSKHHDGYCLWGTDNKHKQNWNSLDVGPKRDLVAELTESVRKSGLKMGLYYSIIDWETNSSYRTENGYFIPKEDVEEFGIQEDKYTEEILLPQLKELVTKFQPCLIFSDGGEWDLSEEQSQTKEFLTWLYNEAPNRDEVVVNDRFHVGMPGKHGDYFCSEYKDVDSMLGQHSWEENRGIGGSFGFNRAENLQDYNSSQQLVMELVDIASRGGNLLLNVGPTADGRIPVIQQERLFEIGSWLDVNGEAIYGTRAGNPARIDGMYLTRKEKQLFLISEIWPEDLVELKVEEEVKKVTMLGLNQEIDWIQIENTLKIYAPKITPKQIPSQYACTYKLEFK